MLESGNAFFILCCLTYQWSSLQRTRLNRKILIFNQMFSMRSVEPFNDRASHYSATHIFGYNSAPAAAREVFTPSTDA